MFQMEKERQFQNNIIPKGPGLFNACNIGYQVIWTSYNFTMRFDCEK